MNGNVGIGTWVPITPFQVNGSSQNVYIASNGNLGVGIVNPTWALTVLSNSNGTYNDLEGLYSPSLTAGHYTEYNIGRDESNYDRATWSFYYAGSNSLNNSLDLFFYGTNPIITAEAKATLASARPHLPAALTVMNGNVGIGTWVPGSLLNIEGGNLGIGTNSPQTSLVSMGNVGIGTWTAAGGNLIVNGGGNVGIGTAWPGVALDVVGVSVPARFRRSISLQPRIR